MSRGDNLFLSEEDLHADERLRLVIDAAPNGMIIIDITGKIVLVNRQVESLFGYRREELLGQPIEILVPERFRGQHAAHREGFFANPQIRSMGVGRDLHGLRKNGTEVPVEIGLNPLPSETVQFVLASIIDISERKQAEAVKADLAAIVEFSDDGILSKTLDGTITSWNNGAARMFGYSAAEILGKSIYTLIPPDRVNEERGIIAKILHSESVEHYETMRRRKDGVDIHVSLTISPIKDVTGRIVGASKIAQNITQRKLNEEELARRTRELQIQRQTALKLALDAEEAQHRAERAERKAQQNLNLLDATRDGVFIFDAHSLRFTYVNQGAVDQVGYSREELLGMTPVDLKPEFDEAQFRQMIAPLINGSSRANTFATIHRRKDGVAVPVEINLQCVAGEGGDSLFVSVVRDVTDRKQAESQIHKLNAELEERVQQRTAQLNVANKELEAFSYSVSHDLRAPLRAIDGFSRILMEDHAAQMPEEALHYLQLVRNNTKQMGHLVDDLLAFSRLGRQRVKRETVAIGRIVQQCLDELKGTLGGRRVEFTLGELPACKADPALLKQVWFNLLANAVKYSGNRPEARIEIGCRSDGNGFAEQVYFVKDNGVGFDMRYAHKLFGVFQRLHRAEDYEGTGVGLAIVQRIIHRHGGRVWAEAVVDQGATFFFSLPGGSDHG